MGEITIRQPHVYAGGAAPIGEIKDVLQVVRTSQLKAQLSVANMTGVPYAPIVSSRIQSVSTPLAIDVQNSGGFVFRVDRVTRNVDVYDVSSRSWIRS
jgi:hypothetical protein